MISLNTLSYLEKNGNQTSLQNFRNFVGWPWVTVNTRPNSICIFEMLFSHFSVLQYPPSHFTPPYSPTYYHKDSGSMTSTRTLSKDGKAGCMVILCPNFPDSVSPGPRTPLTGQDHRLDAILWYNSTMWSL